MPMKKLLITLLLLGSTFVGFSQQRDTTVTATLHFVVNTDRVVENDAYDHFVNVFIPYLESRRDDIGYAIITGSASPEGHYQKNIKLAEQRAARLKTYLNIPNERIVSRIIEHKSSDVDLYPRLRAATVEVYLFKHQVDTIYEKDIEVVRDTIYAEPTTKPKPRKLVLSIYNDLISDLLFRQNIGLEFYFSNSSFFIEGSFSSNYLFGKKYDIQFWHTGLRTYFKPEYSGLFAEVYTRAGYYDTDFFNGKLGMFWGVGGGLGYKFDIGKHWKIYPLIRIGFDTFYYRGQPGGIDISFGKYTNGAIKGEAVDDTPVLEKVIDRNFYDNSTKCLWFGPTYVGLIIQRSFYK